MNKTAVLLLCRSPHVVWVDFLKKLPEQFVCFIIPDEKPSDSKDTNIIYINNQSCLQGKYVRNVEIGIFKPTDHTGEYTPTAWDRALRFITQNNTFDNYWLIEDDVFVPCADTLSIIDNKTPDADLICSDDVEEKYDHNKLNSCWGLMLKDSRHATVPFKTAYQKKQHRQNIVFQLENNNMQRTKQYQKIVNGKCYQQSDFLLPLPWFKTMMCACRVSHKFVRTYSTWLQQNEHVTHHEMFFPTLAHHEGLKIEWCENLNPIKYRQTVDMNNIHKDKLYHPVKRIVSHNKFRL